MSLGSEFDFVGVKQIMSLRSELDLRTNKIKIRLKLLTVD